MLNINYKNRLIINADIQINYIPNKLINFINLINVW